MNTLRVKTGWLRVLTFRKCWNAFLVYLSYVISLFLKKAVVWGSPVSISVEPTNRCNLHCPECKVGSGRLRRQKGNISLDLFKKLVDENRNILVWMNLCFQGEPYLHPQLPAMISYASRAGIYTMVATNGHFLNGHSAMETVKSGLGLLLVSVDGTDQATYEKYRRGGNLSRVLGGVREVVRVKKALNAGHPDVVIQFLVTSVNEHQVDDIRRLGNELGADDVWVKTAQVGLSENPVSWIPRQECYSRYTYEDRQLKLKNRFRNRCLRIWTTAVVMWDGNLVPCCFDKDAAYRMGDVAKNGLRTCWKQKGFVDFRARVLKGRSGINMCRNCTEGLKLTKKNRHFPAAGGRMEVRERVRWS